MRPRNLRLAGFTCYSDPVEIDFSDLDLFVISGPTGAGKSTIIDAICYALYGRVPRSDAKSTTALISHNRNDMHAALEFEAGGERYRVFRGINTTRKTGKDGTERVTRNPSPVVLEHLCGEDWEPIEGRVRGIDGEIERILGLDFDAFTKCVLLPQGRFQEFLTGERKDRDRLLVELLGTGIYEEIKKRANAHAADLTRDAGAIERRLAEDYADATPEALAATGAAIAVVSPQLDAARQQRDALQQAAGLAARVVDARKRERERNEQHAESLAKAGELKTLAEAGEQQVDGLRATVVEAERELADLAYDRLLHRELQVAHDKANSVAALEHDLVELRATATAAGDVTRAAAALESAERAATAAIRAREDAELRRAEVQREESAEHVRAGLKPGDACPVCGAIVGTLPKTKAGNVSAAEKAVRTAQATERSSSDAVHAAELALQSHRQALDHAADQATKIEAGLASVRNDLAAHLPAHIAADCAAIAAAVAVQDAASARDAALNEERDDARRALDDLQPKIARAAQEIAACEADAKRLGAEATAAGAEAGAAKNELATLTGVWRWDDVIQMIDAKGNPAALLKTRLQTCQSEADALTARKAALQQTAERIEHGIARAAELGTELKEKRERAALYGELGRLLRSDQFQAFVIEEAMQALAETASSHLSTLYDRFAMTVEHGEFQVVDHWQADQKRPARTLSGGETFVAALALALALSERLPELRSTTSAVLESLFLDEGFGTLDPEVLDIVISALEGLRSEERMVGIITHVPELARRIESRIEVTKSPAGSTAAAR